MAGDDLNQGLIDSLKLSNGDPQQFNWDELYSTAGKKYGVDPSWIKAIYQQESSEGRDTLNPSSGAMGPGQFMWQTAKEYKLDHPWSPSESVDATARYLASSKKRFGSDAANVFSSYYGGPDSTKWKQGTKDYGKKVLEKLEILQQAQPVAQPAAASDPGINPDVVKQLRENLTPEDQAQAQANATGQPGPQPAQQQAPVTDQGGNVPWGLAQEIPNAMLLGTGPNIIAGLRTGVNKLTGEGSGSLGEDYSRALNEEQAARRRWQGEAPASSFTSDVVGSALPISAGLKGVIGTARLGVEAAEAAAPWLAKNVLRPGLEFIEGTAGAGGGAKALPLRVASRLTAGAEQGAGSGFMASDLNPDVPRSEQTATGAVIGAGANAILGPVGGMIANAVVGKISPALAKIGQMAESLGIDVRPGQLAGNRMARGLDAALNHGADEHQLAQFQRAVSHAFGEDSDTLSPELVQRAWNRTGALKDRLLAQSNLGLDQQFVRDFADHANQLSASGLEPSVIARVNKVRAAVADVFTKYGGTIPGTAYADLTRSGGAIDLMRRSSDPGLQHFGQQLREMLDGLAERSMPPGVRAQYADVMAQRKVLNAIQPVIGTGQSRGGVVDPRAVATALRNEFNVNQPGAGPRGVNVLANIGPHMPKVTPEGSPASGHGTMEWIKQHPGVLLAGVGEAAHRVTDEPAALLAGLLAGGAAGGAKMGYKMLTQNPAFQRSALEAASQGRSVWNYLGLPNPAIPPAVVTENQRKDHGEIKLWYNEGDYYHPGDAPTNGNSLGVQ